MKPKTANLSEPSMQFFTPELVGRFNSADDEEADQANDAWENALQKYREHLEGMRDRMPSEVRNLAELCFHDAELLACEELEEPFSSGGEPSRTIPSIKGIVFVRHQDRIASINYLLRDHLRE